MSDLKLSDGREVDIDLYKISIREWRNLIGGKTTDEEDYEIFAKIIGWSADEVANLPLPDFRTLGTRIAEKSTNPLSDPNLSSESDSTSKEKAEKNLTD